MASIGAGCGRSSTPSYAASRSTTIASRSSSGFRPSKGRPEARPSLPKPIGNIVQTATPVFDGLMAIPINGRASTDTLDGYRCAQPILRSSAQEHQLRIVITPPLQLGESLRRNKACVNRLLHHDQCVRHQPPAVARRDKRAFGEALGVGRIEKDERERVDRAGVAELRGIAPKYAGRAAKPQRRDIVADQGAGFGGIVDEEREACAARERFEAERAGA